MNQSLNRLAQFAEASTSPYHASLYAEKVLSENGFEKLNQTASWNLLRGGAYYTVCFGTTVVAFTVGEKFRAGDDLRIAAAHLDWPCLHVKPSPEQVAGGCCKLNIEPYGGMILSSWYDRPLSVAGVVSVVGEDGGAKSVTVDFEEPILTVPNLAIHMNREVNRGVETNPARDMLPILRTVEDDWNKNGYFIGLLAKKLGVKAEEILSYDLCVYNAEKGCVIGAEHDLFSAPRLDNITSVSACVYGLSEGRRKSGINVAVLYDHEEVGSKTKQGANSATLTMLIEKIALSLGLDRANYLNLLMGGMLLSCDVAHATHPNHTDLSDASCHAYMNRGAVIKMNHNQRYPTDAAGVGDVFALCKKEGIAYQSFMNRADLAGGSTIGADASSHLGMVAVDCGVPILSMHSAREVMGAYDQEAMDRLVAAFYRN